MSTQRVDVSYNSILRVLLVLAALFFIFIIRDVIALVFVAIFLTAAITPWVNWFHKRNVPRGLAVLIIYIIAIGIVSLAVGLVIPPVIEQVGQLTDTFPEFFQKLFMGFSDIRQFGEGTEASSFEETFQSFQAALSSTTQGLFDAVSSIFGGFIFFTALLVLTFYMIVNEELLMKLVQQVTPKPYRQYAISFIERSQVQLGKWLRGQLLLMFSIFVLTYIGLSLFGIKYALVLALVAGLLEIIPYAGPLISAVPAVIIALSMSPWLAVAMVLLYFGVQQIENNLLVPKIMQKAVGLNPLVTIIAILVGAQLGGIVGAVIAVPVTTVLFMFFGDIHDRKLLKANHT